MTDQDPADEAARDAKNPDSTKDDVSWEVLLADDDAVSRKLVQVRLERAGYRVRTADDGEEAWAILSERAAPRLAVLDWEMPGLDGVEICRRLRERTKERPHGAEEEDETASRRYTYAILLTGRDHTSDLVDGFEAGADDYLTKPVEVAELRARLRAGQRIIELQSRLLVMQKRLAREASHDALTGLWNRRAILALLDRELERAKRQRSPVSVFMLDLDHFKQVNDTYGHQVGDEVLVAAAQRFAGAVRGYDAVGRYGGEEFLVVLSGAVPPDGRPAGERLRKRLADEPLPSLAGPLEVTASIGMAWYTDERQVDAHTLLQAADRALYRAKENGRNRVELASPEDYQEPV